MIMENNSFLLSLSLLNIEVKCRSDLIHNFCMDFLNDRDENVDFSVEASQKEVAEEMEKYNVPHSEEYCESVCIYREIAERLPMHNRAVFHGAAVEADGAGYIFTAPSGVGKSTHIKLWQDCFGDRVNIINGDKPIISVDDTEARVWGSPWAGKERWYNNCAAPLKAICILKRGEQNKIHRVDPKECFDTLMSQIYFPKNGQAVLKTLDIAEKLASQVEFYVLECNISKEAAMLSFETRTGMKI